MANLISFSFNRLPTKDMGVFTANVIQQMSADAQFVSLKPEVDALKSLYEPFWAAYTDALKGGSDRLSIRNTRQETMRLQLHKLGLLTEILAEGDASIILAAGFDLRKMTKTIVPEVSTPTNLTAEKGNKMGSVALAWKGTAGVVSFDIESRTDGTTEWQNGKHTTQQSIMLYGFQPGKLIEFRVCANGRGETESDFTPPVGLWIS